MTSAVNCRPLNASHWSSFIAHPPFARAELATSRTRRAGLQQNQGVLRGINTGESYLLDIRK
jgi:hypothetical protein